MQLDCEDELKACVPMVKRLNKVQIVHVSDLYIGSFIRLRHLSYDQHPFFHYKAFTIYGHIVSSVIYILQSVF